MVGIGILWDYFVGKIALANPKLLRSHCFKAGYTPTPFIAFYNKLENTAISCKFAITKHKPVK